MALLVTSAGFDDGFDGFDGWLRFDGYDGFGGFGGCDGSGDFDGYDGSLVGFKPKQRRDNYKRRSRGPQKQVPE